MTEANAPDAGMDAARVQELIATYRDGLLTDTLPFWIDHAVDREHGGFMTSLNRDGAIIDTDKGVWQQGRFTWLLGELFNSLGTDRGLGMGALACTTVDGNGRPPSPTSGVPDRETRDQWLELALHGIRFIEAHGFDPADGRLWFHLTREGRPLRKRRYAFSESFVAIAYGELAKATGDARYAEQARRTFQRFLDHNLSPQGVEPKSTGTRPTQGLGFPMITIATAQELRDSIGFDEADTWIDRSIETIRCDHLKPDLQCVMETVAPGGGIIDHADGRTLNPGHAIEGAWFIMLEGKLRGDPDLIQTGCTMLDWMWARGWDDEYGGLLYFVDVHGLPVQEYWHDMKFWWPHNEAIIATLLAWQLTGNPKYAAWHRQVHDWSYQHFPDRQHGEWYGYLHRDGRISVPSKGNLWKGPFHFPRMQFVCWQLLEEIANKRPIPTGS